jgi:segregation and condensation protein B
VSDSGLRLPSDPVRDEARRAIEALVLVAEDPLDTNVIGQLLELSPLVVDELCRGLAEEYEAEGRGFQLVRVAGGWRYQTHPDQAAYVERFVLEGQTAKLSAAALETLAIVAYKQPISRAQVASIRGVSADGVMRTLTQRGYIAELGRDTGPGQAVLYGTTRSFLEQLGLDDLSQLPPLGDFVPSAAVVEQLEQGLRPEGMASPDRYEAAAATEAFIAGGGRAEHGDGGFDRDLDAELGADVEDRPVSRDGLDHDAGDGSGDSPGAGADPSGGTGTGLGTRSDGDGEGDGADRGGWPGDRSRP